MATLAERESVIVANLADLAEGFFTFETTEKGAVARLQRMAGGRLEVEEHRSSLTGRATGWTCRVPAELWGGLGVRRKPEISEAERQARQDRGRAAAARLIHRGSARDRAESASEVSPAR